MKKPILILGEHPATYLFVSPTDTQEYPGSIRRNAPLAITPGAARGMLIPFPAKVRLSELAASPIAQESRDIQVLSIESARRKVRLGNFYRLHLTRRLINGHRRLLLP
jgi:hypothetical protein